MPDKRNFKAAVYIRLANDPDPPTALYCRTATKTNLPDSPGIEAQTRRLLHFAEENGYTDPVLYIDDGESGLTLDRPAMNQLMADIESGKVKTVIVTSADRIARGIDLLMTWILNMKWTGIRCLSLEDGGKDIRCGSKFITDLLYDMIPGLSKPLDGSCCPLRKSAD